LWAEEYERDLRDLLALQSAVAHDVAREVRAKLTTEDEKHLAGFRPVDPAAHEAYLRGTFFLNKRVPAAVKTAMEYFQQAIALDPNYAQAHVGLAECYVMGGGKDSMDEDGYQKLKAAAQAALALDATLAEPHAALARGAADLGDGATAEREFHIALQLNPNLATAHEWYGMFLNWRGRFEHGIEEFKQALALDPASPRINARLGFGFTSLRRYDEAIAQLQRAVEMDPYLWITHSLLADAYQGKGRFDDAIAEYRKSMATAGWPSESFHGEELYIGIAYALSGRKKLAWQIERRARKFLGNGVDPLVLAELYAALGERQLALQWMGKACHTSEDNCAGNLRASQVFDTLRSDPEFVEISRRSGLTN
jgi:Tfp pilus assembly protein PilF